MNGTHDITRLLQEANQGNTEALNSLWAAVHDELRKVARRHMGREFGDRYPGVTLQPTALVNEAYLNLIKQRTTYDNRGHFFAIATRVLIRVLRDYERERSAAKRGSGWARVPLDPDIKEDSTGEIPGDCASPIEDFTRVLDRLESLDQRKAEVVKLRLFWGLTIEETAQAMGVGHATIQRDWEFARTWLRKELKGRSL